MTSNLVEFLFRIWTHPEDGDPPDIEVWYPGLEPLQPRTCLLSEWASNSLQEWGYDFWDLFDLPRDKHWQVVGRAKIVGSYDYYGEYDEDLDILEFEKAEVPDSYYGEDTNEI